MAVEGVAGKERSVAGVEQVEAVRKGSSVELEEVAKKESSVAEVEEVARKGNSPRPGHRSPHC